MECYRIFHVLARPVPAYYLKLVVHDCRGTGTVWHDASVRHFSMLLQRLIFVAEQGDLEIGCYDLRMGISTLGYWSCLPLPCGVTLTITALHTLILTDCASDSALANLWNCHSAKIDWASVNERQRWNPYISANGRMYALLEAFFPL